MTAWVGADLPPLCDGTVESGAEPTLVKGAYPAGPAASGGADPAYPSRYRQPGISSSIFPYGPPQHDKGELRQPVSMRLNQWNTRRYRLAGLSTAGHNQ